jgi:hypothetical protein
MAGLVVAHLRDDRTTLRIGHRQPLDVRGQMLFDLALGLDDEAEVGAIAGDAGRQADRERSRIPERIQKRRSRAELGQPLLRPRQMVLLVPGRGSVARADVGVARDDRLRCVQRLRADFACMVDTHQTCGVVPFMGFERGLGQARTRGGARCVDGSRQRAQRTVEADDQGVDIHGRGGRWRDVRPLLHSDWQERRAMGVGLDS